MNPAQYNDVMTDIETFGKKPGCVIRSIGAQFFNPHLSYTIPGENFYLNICPESCKAVGLTIDPETEKWWLDQSIESQEHLQDNQWHIVQALHAFSGWFTANGGRSIWCQGATFDAPILEHAMNLCDVPVPWNFWAVRDTRTVYDICGYDPTVLKREGTYHNALHDAQHQIKLVYKALHNDY